jgi:hypothetical protein
MELVSVKAKDLKDEHLVLLDGFWFTVAALAASVKAAFVPDRFYVTAAVK